MDRVSAASAVIPLVQVAAQASSALTQYISPVKGAEDSRAKLVDQITLISTAAKAVKSVVQHSSASLQTPEQQALLDKQTPCSRITLNGHQVCHGIMLPPKLTIALLPDPEQPLMMALESAIFSPTTASYLQLLRDPLWIWRSIGRTRGSSATISGAQPLTHYLQYPAKRNAGCLTDSYSPASNGSSTSVSPHSVLAQRQ
jgi:hypothetical protein